MSLWGISPFFPLFNYPPKPFSEPQHFLLSLCFLSPFGISTPSTSSGAKTIAQPGKIKSYIVKKKKSYIVSNALLLFKPMSHSKKKKKYIFYLKKKTLMSQCQLVFSPFPQKAGSCSASSPGRTKDALAFRIYRGK